MRKARLCIAAILLALALAAGAAGEPLIVLLTDYGERDFYVGALKGSIYKVHPGARIDSITHDIPAFDVRAGSRTLARASREFPDGTILVAIVDPGVGTVRKPVAILTRSGKVFIGPDNGIFTDVMRLEHVSEVREITNRKLMREGEISVTFQGRDIFGPVAAHVARGVPFRTLGPKLEEWTVLPGLIAAELAQGRLSGAIEDIDAYGNLITNIPRALAAQMGLSPGQKIRLRIGQTELQASFVTTYADVPEGGPLALVNSQGLIELAVNMGNLAERAKCRRGDQVTIEQAKEKRP